MSATHPHRLLVVDDEPDLRTLYELTLVREGYDVECASSVTEAWAMLQGQAYQLLITDMRLPDGTGLDLLRQLEQAGRHEKAVVITAYGSAENAVEALKAGAYDYLTKPVDLKQFRAVVASALGRPVVLPVVAAPSGGGDRVGERTGERGSAQGSERQRAASRRALERLAGTSHVMQQVRGLIEKVARSMAPVLVCGESGTGKELVARAIHEVSPRGEMPFVAVNCGAIPENLLEAEFFGYRKGAFTGAHEDRVGFFQAAQGGTIFLDEIGDLPLAMQSKLLRVIQERVVRPLGAVAEHAINVRILSATHKDLGAEVQGGRFRQDLFYRLNVIQIAVPPLRERSGDLPLICATVLERLARDAGVTPVPVLSSEALDMLQRHSFPGNVRELENLLHRAVALSGGELITREDLALPDPAEGESVLGELDMAMARDVSEQVQASPPQPPLPSDLVRHLDQIEREILVRALERYRYNRTAAGASLGLSLRQMRYRMARLGITAGELERDGM
jgi:two-component system, NtrC family, response regulator PilR